MFRRIIFIFLAFGGVVCSVTASTADSLRSVYRDGQFETRYTSRIRCSKTVAVAVADYLVSDFQNSPGHLFEWAFRDLGLQNKNNEVIIVFKSSSFNPKTGIIHGVFDIDVPYFKTFRNIEVQAMVTKTRYTNGAIKLKTEILYSTMLLKSAVGTLTFVPLKNNYVQVITESNIGFGWFFNLFITQKRYKSIVEWRLRKFEDNVIDECERRYRHEMKKLACLAGGNNFQCSKPVTVCRNSDITLK